MTEDRDEVEEKGAGPAKKRSKLPMILGLVLALLGAGGGFAAVQMGLLSGDSEEGVVAEADQPLDLGTPKFLPLETLVINLPDTADAEHLLFTAELEVNPIYSDDVSAIKPRIVDVLNSYLRAVRLSELQDPTALVRLRAQMLRRVQVVAGEDRVKDMLIMEFVLN